MTPILYEKDEIDFTSQGLGSLVEIYDVDVEEQRNGLLQLTASYPVSGVRYADISVGRIILAKPNQRDDVHAFRIVSTELDISGYAVKIEADSITYDLTHNVVKHLVASGIGQAFMTALKNAVVNPSIFAFYSDIATSSTTSLNYVNPMEAIMGTTGSFLQIWGGELKRENRRVAMFNRRGRDNVATFRLGKNISGLKYSVDISSLVTRIIPTKSVQNDNQTTTILEGAPVDSQYINNYEQIYTLPLEFTDDTIKTVADLNAAAKGWFTKSANTGRDKPTVTIDIDVLSLQDSADYQDKFKNLESVSLTDTVTVYVPEYGVNVTAVVNELHYDPILDRVTKMTVGTAKQSFADSSRTQLSDLQDKIISVQNQADAVAVSANGKSTNYYGSVKPSHPQKGDAWFWVNGDKSGVKVFVNGDWVEPVDSDTQEKIEASVTKAVAQANAHTDEVKQGLSSDIATAKSQAASLASTAEANAKSEAVSQFNRAQNALSDAKKDLMESVASEASQAVAAANSQAQNYVNQAKRDINDTINALSVGGRNLLIGTNSNAKSWINAGGGSYTTQYVAFDNGYKFSFSCTEASTWWAVYMFSGLQKDKFKPNTDYVLSFMANVSTDIKPGVHFANNAGQHNFVKQVTSPTILSSNGDQKVVIQLRTDSSIPSESDQSLYINGFVNKVGTFSIWDLKIETGNLPTDWTPAPEDVVLDYTTKDNKIKETISQYQETNDGKVKKVQTDVTTVLGQVATKVSQTDYDKKTGELSEKINKAKDTADESLRTIGDYKTSNDKRVHDAESSIERTANAITAKVSQTDYDKKTGELTNDLSELKHTAEGFEETVTKVKNLSVGGRNLLLGTEQFAGDMNRWQWYGTWDADPYNGHKAVQTIVAWGGPKYIINDLFNRKVVSANTDYTLSVKIKNTSNSPMDIYFFAPSIGISDRHIINLPPNSDWTTISTTFQFSDINPNINHGTMRFEPNSHTPAWQGTIIQTEMKFERGTIATDWTPAPEDTETALAQVKITADGISKFVRDSSGNLSSDFQTALSKTSIITDSTLATSIQKQTATQISSAITDNNGKIISLINQDSSGVQIAGKNLAITADTKVDGNFWAKQVNAVQVNASNITVGTLNGNQVNITNINADNIVSGAISGANLNINLNNGSVVFQKGRINSSDYTTDINIDQGYISTANDNTRALIKQGMIQLVAPNRFDLDSSPYMEISNNRGQSTAGAAIIGRDSVSIANSKNAKNIFPAPIGEETFSGLYTGQAFDGGWLPTKVGGANRGVVVAGGTETTWQIVNNSPYIWVGTDAHGSSGYGNRVFIEAEYLHATTVYNHYASGGGNVYISSDGALLKSSSATKYKTNIEHETDSIQGDQLLTINPATWNDKFESEQLERYHETGVEPERQINMEGKRYYGIIAEDLVKAGLEELVTRNEETDEVEGVEYSKIGVALIPIVRDLRDRLNEQYVEIERLKDKIK